MRDYLIIHDKWLEINFNNENDGSVFIKIDDIKYISMEVPKYKQGSIAIETKQCPGIYLNFDTVYEEEIRKAILHIMNVKEVQS